MKRTLRMLYIITFKPKREDTLYLISTTGNVDTLLNETARMFGFTSFEKFAQCMWPFDTPTSIHDYSTLSIRGNSTTSVILVNKSEEQVAAFSYYHYTSFVETHSKRRGIETPILIADPKLIPLIAPLVSSKTV